MFSLTAKTHPSHRVFDYTERIGEDLYRINAPMSLLAVEFPLIGSNFAVRRSSAGVFNTKERQFEDCLFIFEQILQSNLVVYLDRFSILYNQGQSNKLSQQALRQPKQLRPPRLYKRALSAGYAEIAGNIFQIWISYLATRSNSRKVLVNAVWPNRRLIYTNFKLNYRCLSLFLRIFLPIKLFNILLNYYRQYIVRP